MYRMILKRHHVTYVGTFSTMKSLQASCCNIDLFYSGVIILNIRLSILRMDHGYE